MLSYVPSVGAPTCSPQSVQCVGTPTYINSFGASYRYSSTYVPIAVRTADELVPAQAALLPLPVALRQWRPVVHAP